MRSRRLVFGTGLAVAALLACGGGHDGDTKGDNNFREDVIECEDALAKLEKCCPSFDATPALCNYYDAHTSGSAFAGPSIGAGVELLSRGKRPR